MHRYLLSVRPPIQDGHMEPPFCGGQPPKLRSKGFGYPPVGVIGGFLACAHGRVSHSLVKKILLRTRTCRPRAGPHSLPEPRPQGLLKVRLRRRMVARHARFTWCRPAGKATAPGLVRLRVVSCTPVR